MAASRSTRRSGKAQDRPGEVPGVRVSVAARLLGLSEPTVRAWAAQGLLEVVAGAKPARVTTESLARVLPLVEALREQGRDRDLVRAVVDALEAERVRSLPRVRRSLAQVRRSEYELVSSGDL